MTKTALDNGIQRQKRVFPVLQKLAGTDEETRTVRFVLSTETADRVDDVVKVDGWQLENYKANPVVLWSHDHKFPPIGKMTKIGVEKKALVGDVQFASAEEHAFADTIYRLVKGGYINAGSVGFIPLEWTYDEERHGYNIVQAELLEYSIVGVPMNPDARRRAMNEIDFEPIERTLKSCGPSLGTSSLRNLIADESAIVEPARSTVGRYAKRAAVSAAKMRF